jgi:hypothetical protein
MTRGSGSCDDGSCDDGSCDDGSCDDGSCDDAAKIGVTNSATPAKGFAGEKSRFPILYTVQEE